ncbi:uncharacterized protein LOC129946353 [Eupeodes corollae]|uniref:uncharacterized protein LOC129946353 n=1 Tax=Eupeodes corollae TaxID=290404 RepID=UPI00248FADC9|nr:uncharacterized protein LOC129946353 [Eupeodes corollae]
MKSSKSFLICLLAGLFISANCAALESENKTTDKPADVALTTTLSITESDLNESTTVPSVTNVTTDPTPDNTTVPPETTTSSSTSSTTTPATTTSSTTTPATTTSTTTSSTTSTTSTTPAPNSTTTTTPVPSPTTTTEIPSTTAAPPVPCHHFNGTSFIGGIVLTLGLLAISLVAYKFYKARNERNYHTL